jgi:hypothetical protein
MSREASLRLKEDHIMNNFVASPPTWARNIFYLLIGIVLSAIVVTFILRASCIFTESTHKEIINTVVVFGVGISIICGILWVGGVTGLINISTGFQKAIWVTLIAAILSTTVSVYKGFFSASTYRVIGTLKKSDGKDPCDISILTRYPPFFPEKEKDNEGKIVGLDVWEEPNGRLPILSFSLSGYKREIVDLNDRTKVEKNDGELKIKETIELVPIGR